MTSFDDVFGAEQASKELRARDYAVLQEIAARTSQFNDLARITEDYMRAGLTRYVRAARRELIEVYELDNRDRDDALATLRRMIEPAIDDSGPDNPGVEDYNRSDGLPL